MVQTSYDGKTGQIRFFDPIGNDETKLRARDASALEPTGGDPFPVDLDGAFTLRASKIEFDRVPSVAVRQPDGLVIDTCLTPASEIRHEGCAVVEVCTPVKVYIRTEDGVVVTTRENSTSIDFSGRIPVTLGARVKRDRPRTTVITTDDMSDVFDAITAFGALARPAGPERSFPTLRPHPPLIEFGPEAHVPDYLAERPGRIRIDVPGTYLHAAMAAPLAYYLGAAVEIAESEPGIRVDGEPLTTWTTDMEIESACENILQRTLFLDCLARRSRGYGIDLEERAAVDDTLAIDWEAVAELEMADRLHRYEMIPAGTIADQIPAWTDRAFAVPQRRTIESLPFLAYDLVSIHRPRGGSSNGHVRARDPENDLVSMPLGAEEPVGTDPAFPAALRNRLNRDSGNETISVTVVCNDRRMLEEHETVEQIYAGEGAVSIEVHPYEGLGVDELASVLGRQTDYFHYIGHIERGGFDCVDGVLDARSVSMVGIEVFFLNACQSIPQAQHLITAGALGGIATRRPIANSGAGAFGQSMAEVITRGYPLAIALRLARAQDRFGRHYHLIGDPRANVGSTESGIPYVGEIESAGKNFRLQLSTVLSWSVGKGSVGAFHIDKTDTVSLNPMTKTFEVDPPRLEEFLSREEVLVRWEDRWYWSEECLEELRLTAV